MSHHGNDNPELERQMHEAMEKIFGEFPDGKLRHIIPAVPKRGEGG